MRYLGEIEFGSTVKNLTSEVGISRSIFSNFPQQVKHDTAYERNCKLNLETNKWNIVATDKLINWVKLSTDFVSVSIA